jgi:scyllo-inositol 2-dehydrogenase (NADP+)
MLEGQPFNWGVMGAAEKVQAFADDLPYATHFHRLKAVVGGEGLELPGATVVSSLDQLLQSGIDAVYIATAFNQHYEQVVQCLEAGVPVLCERPIALNAGQLQRLMQLSADNGTFMMEAMWIRFLPSIKKILSIVSSGTIGEVVSVKASISPRFSDRSTQTAEERLATLMEIGSYPVFLATLFLGKPEYVQATGKVAASGKRELFAAFLSYRQGQYSFLEMNLNLGISSAHIQGDKGSVLIRNPWSPKPEGIEVDLLDGTKVLHRSEWPGMGLHFELDEVAACVRKRVTESPLFCHHFMLDVVHTVDAIRTQLA